MFALCMLHHDCYLYKPIGYIIYNITVSTFCNINLNVGKLMSIYI